MQFYFSAKANHGDLIFYANQCDLVCSCLVLKFSLLFLTFRTKVCGSLSLNYLLDGSFALNARQAKAIINFGLQHEVAWITVAIHKIFQATATRFDRSAQGIFDRRRQHRRPWLR